MDKNPSAQSSINTIYIMLNIDQTILDRVSPYDNQSMKKLVQKGFDVQELTFQTNKQLSPKFVSIYEKISKGSVPEGQSKFLCTIKSKKIGESEFEIQECIVVRPGCVYLLNEIFNIGIPVKFLLTSRNDDVRTQNVQKRLAIKINNQSFENMTTFIPRDWFRIKNNINGKETSVKSAALLRKRYAHIQTNDFVILLDHIEESRFIKGNQKNDRHIFISKFDVSDSYDVNKDCEEMKRAVEKIKHHLGNRLKIIEFQ